MEQSCYARYILPTFSSIQRKPGSFQASEIMVEIISLYSGAYFPANKCQMHYLPIDAVVHCSALIQKMNKA